MSELLEDQINKLDDTGYTQYLKMHLFYCERPEHLGKDESFSLCGKKNRLCSANQSIEPALRRYGMDF